MVFYGVDTGTPIGDRITGATTESGRVSFKKMDRISNR